MCASADCSVFNVVGTSSSSSSYSRPARKRKYPGQVASKTHSNKWMRGREQQTGDSNDDNKDEEEEKETALQKRPVF